MKAISKKIIIILGIILVLGGLIFMYYPSGMRLYREHLVEKYKKIHTSDDNTRGYCHFSIDDTIAIFMDLTENEDKYQSIFDNETLSYLKYLHDTYGTVFSMYCYYDQHGFDLTMATDAYAEEFRANSDWLKFGFHGKDEEYTYAETDAVTAKADYEHIIDQLERICGGTDAIDRIVRVSRFQGNQESILAMKECQDGIIGLLSADDDRGSYYLEPSMEGELQAEKVKTLDGITYWATDYRIEYMDQMKEVKSDLQDDPNWILFTHEYFLNSRKFQSRIENLMLWAVENGYTFSYPQMEE